MSGTLKDVLYVVGGLAVIAFFIVRQRRSDRFRERSILFPIALGVYGVVLLTDTSEHISLSIASAVLLVLSGLASVGFGVIRGRTIELFERGGEVWERASWTTIGVGWCGLLVTRIVLIGVATAIGARLAASPTSIPVMLGITLAAQMVVEKRRARAVCVPLASARAAVSTVEHRARDADPRIPAQESEVVIDAVPPHAERGQPRYVSIRR